MRKFLIGVVFLASCGESHTIYHNGERFTLRLDTVKVDSSRRIPPISVHDEISPGFRIYLSDGSDFVSPKPLPQGFKIVNKVYVRNP